MLMKKLAYLSLVVILCIFGAPSQSRSETSSANLVGTVLDAAGNPVQGIEITAKDPTGKIIGQSVTDAKGQYILKKLPVGEYDLTLDPKNTGYQGATVVTSMVKEGLTVNWTVSNTAPAVAIAAATPDAAAKQKFFAAGSTGRKIAAFTVGLGGLGGILAASGVFDSNNSSPSQ